MHGENLAPQHSIPAMVSLKNNNVKTILPVPGDLTHLDRARIINWFEVHIIDGRQNRHHWILHLPMAHATTVLLAYRLSKGKNENDAHMTANNLRKAWEYQVAQLNRPLGVDIDRECLRILEERMFEESFRAGIAGYRQWGLDAGDHQQAWDPYTGRPDTWIHGDYEGHPDERLVRTINCHCHEFWCSRTEKLGPKYIYFTPPPRPRPRPIYRGRQIKTRGIP